MNEAQNAINHVFEFGRIMAEMETKKSPFPGLSFALVSDAMIAEASRLFGALPGSVLHQKDIHGRPVKGQWRMTDCPAVALFQNESDLPGRAVLQVFANQYIVKPETVAAILAGLDLFDLGDWGFPSEIARAWAVHWETYKPA